MSDRIKPPLLLSFPDRVPHGLDRLLRDFFRAELPAPWPVLKPPEARPDRPTVAGPRRWSALGRRLVLAASVAFLLVGYLVLARAFPGTAGGSGLHLDPAGPIGSKITLPGKGNPLQQVVPLPASKADPQGGTRLAPPRTVTTPKGWQARMWEQHLPGRGIRIDLQSLEPAKSRP
jgi:hypothetical protein